MIGLMIQIFEPVALNEKGHRGRNEDSIYPPLDNASNGYSLFIVCDGLGGGVDGHVASALACRELAKYYNTHDGSPGEALQHVENEFSKHLKEHPISMGMGTTIACLRLPGTTIEISWVGDSRVYHVRDGKILYQTSDHSLVNELVKKRALSPGEARWDNRKNIVTRAVMGNNYPTRIDSFMVTDIKENDFFMLCSDGILESVGKQFIQSHFLESTAPEHLGKIIKDACMEESRDNYSMYLIKIKSID